MSKPLVDRIDHFVLTVASVEAACAFYEKALGMKTITFAGGRTALSFGEQKINLHRHGAEFVPHARTIAPGSGDFCLTTTVPLDEIVARGQQRNRLAKTERGHSRHVFLAGFAGAPRPSAEGTPALAAGFAETTDKPGVPVMINRPVLFSPSVEEFKEDEAKTIGELNRTFDTILHTTAEDYHHAVRAVHAKAHGVLEGVLTIDGGLPPELSQGLFAQPGSHKAYLRLSTNAGQDHR